MLDLHLFHRSIGSNITPFHLQPCDCQSPGCQLCETGLDATIFEPVAHLTFGRWCICWLQGREDTKGVPWIHVFAFGGFDLGIWWSALMRALLRILEAPYIIVSFPDTESFRMHLLSDLSEVIRKVPVFFSRFFVFRVAPHKCRQLSLLHGVACWCTWTPTSARHWMVWRS